MRKIVYAQFKLAELEQAENNDIKLMFKFKNIRIENEPEF